MNLFNIVIPQKRVFGLDVLRAISILMVILEHGNYYMPRWFAEVTKHLYYSPITIFFVLSGFLIGRILIKQLNTSEFSIDQLFIFWKNRWFRTLPAYLLVLFVLSIFYRYNDSNYNLKTFLNFLTFTQNFAWEHPEGFFEEAWSLSVEEWFYLCIPLTIFLLSKTISTRPLNALLITSVILIILIPIYRYGKVIVPENYSEHLFDVQLRKQVLTRLDSLMYGVLAAYLSMTFKQSWNKSSLIKLLLGIIIIICSKSIFNANDIQNYIKPTFQFCFESFGVFLMLPHLCKIKEGSGLLFKLITTISLTSYSAYLIHRSVIQFVIINQIPFIESLNFSISTKSIVSYVLYWLLTISCSILMYKYFEVPTTKLRERNYFNWNK